MVAQPLGLSVSETLSLIRESDDTNSQHLHFEEKFRGIPIWGDRVVVSRSKKTNSIERLGGSVVNGIADDIPNLAPAISTETALRKARDLVRLGGQTKGISAASSNPVFSDERTRLVVYVRPADLAAKLSYEVSFLAVRNVATAEPTRPVFLIDAMTGETLYYFDALTYADGTGPGGNQKTNEYFYGPGKEYPPFEVTDAGNGQCLLSNSFVDTDRSQRGLKRYRSPVQVPLL